MQDIHGLVEPGDLDDPVGARGVAHPDLACARTHGGHRLPVRWIPSCLDCEQLEAGAGAGRLRESRQVVPCASDEADTLDTRCYTKNRIIANRLANLHESEAGVVRSAARAIRLEIGDVAEASDRSAAMLIQSAANEAHRG